MKVNKSFMLTDSETKLIYILLRTVSIYTPDTQIRFAGGWIRDKLLNLESDDIDVAIDNMSGVEFAKLVHKYMKSTGRATSKVTKIEANTEANKNLESAILKIGSIDVDFTQLRREFYGDDSRNPLIEVGVTAEQDAHRRDLTINAMFYNLHTFLVEDYVGGIKDLEDGIIRTPQEPIKTYKEDPLRILRAVRFAARFNFKLDKPLIRAARDPFVQIALKQKISKERIWSEFSKFMIGPNFHYAAELMEITGLRGVFLTLKDDQLEKAAQLSNGEKWLYDFGKWDMEQNNPYHNLSVWDHTMSALKYLHTIDSDKSDTDRLVRNVALLLHDVGKCDICSQQTHPEKGYSTYHEHELSSAYAANIILNNMRAPNEIKTRVVKLVRNHMKLHNLPINANVGLRRVIRDIGATDWSNLVDMSKSDSMGKVETKLDPKYDAFDSYANKFIEALNGKSEVKSPIDGHDVMSILNIKAGKRVGNIMKALKEELIESPDMNREEAVEFINLLQ